MNTTTLSTTDPLLCQMENTIRFNSLRYQCGQTMFCRGCETVLDCNDAVSIDFYGTKSGKLFLTLCLCGKCADRLDTSKAIENGAAKANEPLREERFDGREFDEDGFPIGAQPTISIETKPFLTKTTSGPKEVQGCLITFEGFDGFEFFAYQKTMDDGSLGGWHVVEKSTGLGCSGFGNETLTKAVAAARIQLNKAGLDKFKQLVEKAGPIS